MAGMLRKSMLYLGLVDDEDSFDDYDEEDEEVFAPPRPTVTRLTPEPAMAGATASAGPGSRRGVARHSLAPPSGYRIATQQPRTYNDAVPIGNHFRDGVPVIMNVTDMDDADARRLVDFAAGLAYALRGSLERVTGKVFLLSPSNVTLSLEDKARIAESGFFNQS
jgi:cell division inhibitor SepF